MPTIITRGAASSTSLIIPVPKVYTFTTTQYASPLAYPTQTATLSIYTFFWQSQLSTGKQFTMTGQVTGGTWSIGNTLTTTMTIGTAKTQTIPYNNSKQFYVSNVYDGNQSIYVYGQYNGDPTNFKAGIVSLIGLSLV